MLKFYFTFGQVHRDKQGRELKDRYAVVYANSANEARNIFQAEFADKELEKPDGWSFQYTESDFDPSFYPRGILIELRQKDYI